MFSLSFLFFITDLCLCQTLIVSCTKHRLYPFMNWLQYEACTSRLWVPCLQWWTGYLLFTLSLMFAFNHIHSCQGFEHSAEQVHQSSVSCECQWYGICAIHPTLAKTSSVTTFSLPYLTLYQTAALVDWPWLWTHFCSFCWSSNLWHQWHSQYPIKTCWSAPSYYSIHHLSWATLHVDW